MVHGMILTGFLKNEKWRTAIIGTIGPSESLYRGKFAPFREETKLTTFPDLGLSEIFRSQTLVECSLKNN